LAAEQNSRRHRTIPPCTSQHYTRVSLRRRSMRQDWMRCGGTPRPHPQPVGWLSPHL